MRRTSARRRATPSVSRSYSVLSTLGTKAAPVIKGADYEGDKPSMVCPRCGRRVMARKDGTPRSHSVSHGVGAPWRRCVDVDAEAEPPDRLPELPEHVARQEGLVTIKMIAHRYRGVVSKSTIVDIVQAPHFPSAQALLADSKRRKENLYPAIEVVEWVKKFRPKWENLRANREES